jgi:hypothetical protein
MRPVTQSFTLQAVSATSVAALQTQGSAGTLTLASTSTTDGMAHQLTLTSTGNISGVNFTFTGTDADGRTVTEVLAGPNNNTVTTVNYYKTFTSIANSAAVSTNTSAGVGAGAAGPSVVGDRFSVDSTVMVVVSGTVNYTIQYSDDYPNITDSSVSSNFWVNSTDTDVSGATASSASSATGPIIAYRLTISSYSSTPTISANYVWSSANL